VPNAPSSCLAVVPAYNEAGTIEGVSGALRGKAPQLDVVVIDDGSTDNTVDRAAAAGARVLQLPFNGGAVQADFKPLLRGDD
jgi:glycosyltransferase involved in cell wall biosynthesis